MGGTTGNLGNLLLGLVYAALFGVLACVMLIVLVDYDWNAAVFVGVLVAGAVTGAIALFAGGTLPTLAEIQARPAPVVPRTVARAPVAAPVAAPAPVAAAPVAAAPVTPAPASSAPVALAAAPAAVATATPVAAMGAAVMAAPDDAAIVAAGEGMRPAGLPGPRNGKADDLKNIEGIGPVLEKLCHDMGIYHFDQIAGWGPAEVAWMNANLKGFKGRVGRDKWVTQARLIGSVGMEEFRRRAEANDY